MKDSCVSAWGKGVTCLMTLITWPLVLEASAIYHVRLNTTEFVGTARHLTFDFVSGAAPLNFARISDFTTDGRRGRGAARGGPVSGGLIDGVGPAFATVDDFSFYNQLIVPMDSVGTQSSFDLELSERVAASSVTPDAFAFFFANSDEAAAFPTVDPFGTNSLFAIDVNGQPGGDLSVFAPMRWFCPDSC